MDTNGTKLFGLKKNYTWEQLKSSYRALAIHSHPDKGGNKDLFNHITQEFKKLAIELKKKQKEKTHMELKNEFKQNKNNAVNSVNNDFRHDTDNFNSRFNKMFEENRFVDEDIEFGYGDIMIKSSKKREDINIKNVFHGKSRVTNDVFNQEFNKRVPTTDIVEYQEPEALPSCKSIVYTELGQKTTDYSGNSDNNQLQFTDFKKAFTVSRIPTKCNQRSNVFMNVEDYQQYSDNSIKTPYTQEELMRQEKFKQQEQSREKQRVLRMQQKDEAISRHFDKVSMIGFHK